jgi:hypothetical protein
MIGAGAVEEEEVFSPSFCKFVVDKVSVVASLATADGVLSSVFCLFCGEINFGTGGRIMLAVGRGRVGEFGRVGRGRVGDGREGRIGRGAGTGGLTETGCRGRMIVGVGMKDPSDARKRSKTSESIVFFSSADKTNMLFNCSARIVSCSDFSFLRNER